MQDDPHIDRALLDDAPSRSGPGRSLPQRLRRLLPFAIVPAILALCGAGVGFYINQRDTLQHEYSSGNSTAANRVDLAVTVRKVDPTNGDLVLGFQPDPQGTLANDDGTSKKRILIGTGSSVTPN